MRYGSATIFALATPPGRSGVAVVRVSGAASKDVLSALSGSLPEPRRAEFRLLRDPRTGAELDRALVVFFPGPASFTGEDVAEFHLHGGRAVVAAVLKSLAYCADCRLAEPGEFTWRAFENGKLDLTAAEGLADLIDAETEAQRQQALGQSKGLLGALYDGWRTRIVEAVALVEAGIDFSDEADVSRQAFDQARAGIQNLKADIDRHLMDGHRGELLREGFRVVLAGAPNAGKSSLLNALAGRDVAIVSEHAGTTRDVIEVHLDLGGLPVIVADTAGIRPAEGDVEREGIRRSHERARAADLVLWIIDATDPANPVPPGLSDDPGRIRRVLNKVDLALDPVAANANDLQISAKTGAGLELLIGEIGRIAGERMGLGDGPAITQIRHRQLIEDCARHLRNFLSGDREAIELRAEDLRLAAFALGRITGRVDVEEVLGQIFSRFCIGK